MNIEWNIKYQKAYRKLAFYFIHKYKLQPIKRTYSNIDTYAASVDDKYVEIMINNKWNLTMFSSNYFYFTIERTVKFQDDAAKLMLKFMGYDKT
jgi:hypothetical protein